MKRLIIALVETDDFHVPEGLWQWLQAKGLTVHSIRNTSPKMEDSEA